MRLAVARAFTAAGLAALVPAVVDSGSAPAAAPAPAPASASAFSVLDARVSPRHAYFAGRPLQITFRIAAPAPLALQVEIVRKASGRAELTFALAPAVPGVAQRVEWDGRDGSGKVAPGGAYRVRVRAPDGSARRAGSFTLRSHIYPIRGPHADRGPAGAFGVGRNGGRTHEGFDVNAACGIPLVAARGGIVRRATYDPVLYGHLLVIRGERTRRDYWYAHLRSAPRLKPGDRVLTGQRLGRIGATGNARTIGCHLHFEIRARGRPIDPGPELHAWDAWS